MALLAAWTNGTGDFLIRFGRLWGCWARMAFGPSGSAPVRLQGIGASLSVKHT